MVGVDPEPDTLRLARHTAEHQGVRNATWTLGAETELPELGRLLGERSLALMVVGQALHRLPGPDERDALAERIRQALPAGEPFTRG